MFLMEGVWLAVVTKDRSLDLIAPHKEARQMWVKALNLMLQESKMPVRGNVMHRYIDTMWNRCVVLQFKKKSRERCHHNGPLSIRITKGLAHPESTHRNTLHGSQVHMRACSTRHRKVTSFSIYKPWGCLSCSSFTTIAVIAQFFSTWWHAAHVLWPRMCLCTIFFGVKHLRREVNTWHHGCGYMRMYIGECGHTCRHKHIQRADIHIYACMYAYIHDAYMNRYHAWMHTYIHTYIHAYCGWEPFRHSNIHTYYIRPF